MSKRPHDTDGRERRHSGDLGPLPELYLIFQGEVASVQAYGVFVKIPGSRRQGLVHKSQMSRTRVEDPSEMLSKGEIVYCKVISHGDDGSKIGLSMKVVNQTTGVDVDPNNVELSQDEQRRRTGHKRDIQKIELGAVLNTICKKCGAAGHFAQDCFHVKGGKSYELIPDLDELESIRQDAEGSSPPKKKKKEKKKHKKRKSKDKKSERQKHSDSSGTDSSEDERVRKKHKKHKSKEKKEEKSRKREDSSDSSSDERHSRKHHKHKSERR